jgi:hypothetical protein
VYARIKNANDIDGVREQVLSTFARFTTGHSPIRRSSMLRARGFATALRCA